MNIRGRRNVRQFQRVVTIAAVVATGFSLAACGSTAGDNEQGGSSSGDANSAEAKQFKAEAARAADVTEVTWPIPTEPLILEPGKRVAIVSCGESATGCHVLSSSTADAAKAAGWTSTVFDSKFDTNAAGGFVQQAVSQKYDAIVVIAISPGLMTSAIANARAASIPVGCLLCVYPDAPEYDGVVNVTTSGTEGGTEALGVMAASNANAKAVFFYSPAADFETQKMEAFKLEFAKCSKCEVTIKEVPYDDLSKPGPPFFTGFLATPLAKEVDWIATASDVYTAPSFKTAQNQGVTAYSFAGVDALPEATTPMSETDSAYKLSVITPLQYQSWAVMDLVMRKLQGLSTWDATKMPSGLVTHDNAGFYAKGGIFAPDQDLKGYWTTFWKAS